jgi:hypothetical protein
MTGETDRSEKLTVRTSINGLDDRAAEDAGQDETTCLQQPIKESLEGQLSQNTDAEIAGKDEQELDDSGWLCL